MMRLEALIPPDSTKSEEHNVLVAEGFDDSKIDIFPFRPNWWPEYDALTGKKILDESVL